MAISSDQSKTTAPSHKRHSRAEAGVPTEKARVVLAGARTVFLANGYSAATTDMIQQAAGVSKSTVYSHYPNKEALFVAVVEAECEQFLTTIRKPEFRRKCLADTLNGSTTEMSSCPATPSAADAPSKRAGMARPVG